MANRIISLLKNKALYYVVSRYVTYGIAFINSLLIAAKLGPYNMGVWGFLLLIINYFAQIHFGIGSSLNVLIVHNLNDENGKSRYINNALVLTSFLSVVVILLYVFSRLYNFQIIEQYQAEKYLWMIAAIAIMQYFNIVFVTLLRIHNMIGRVAICQASQILLQLLCISLFNGENLVYSLVCSYLFANIINGIIAITARILPKFILSDISIRVQHEIIKKGLFIFIYNSCFIFIVLTIRTLVSKYYSVSDFGIFTFSFSVANSLILVLDSLSFLIYPKMIHKLSSSDSTVVSNTISNLRTYYISAANFLVFIALLLFPLLLYFLPQYKSGLMVLNTISLATLVNAFSFGYTSMLVAKNQEKFLALSSLFVLIINIAIAIFMIKVLEVPFQFLSIAMMISYSVFCVITINKGRNVIKANDVYINNENKVLIKIGIPLLVAIIISFFHFEHLLFIPLILYLILDYKDIIKIYSLVKNIIRNPEIFNL